MSQREQYPANNQRYQQTSSLAGANRNTALCGTQLTQSSFPPGNANNRPGRSAPLQDAPRQLYQSNQPYRGYPKPDEKRVY